MTDGPDASAHALFPLRAAVELGHGLVQHVADHVGSRVLFIKGPVADAHGLRPPRSSADVDVLLPSSNLDAVLVELGRRGWVRRPESFAHAEFVQHSVTLLHPSWPCDIDLHVTYPGFLADPGAVFEALWAGREPLELGGRPVDAPGFAGSALLAALHSLRAPYLQRNRRELEDALAAVRRRESTARPIEEIAELASATGARHTAEPFLAALGVVVDGPTPRSPEYLAWRRNARQLNRSAQWLRAIADAPAARIPGLLRRAILPSREDLLADHPGTPDTAAGLRVARLIRLANGARAMPLALRTLWEERTRDRSSAAPSPAHPAPAQTSAPRGSSAASSSDSDSPPPTVVAPAHLVRRAPHLGEVSSGDAIVVLDLAGHRCEPVVLSGSGADVWSALRDVRSPEAVSAVVADVFGVDPDAVASDVLAFLGTLVELRLVSRVAPAAPPRTAGDGARGSDAAGL